MIARMFATLALIIGLGFGVVWLMPTDAPSTSPIALVTVTPTTLPPCENEDGSGQMLCMWDASESGNGMGTDVVAGDCSADTMATYGALAGVNASAECMKLYTMNPYDFTDVDGVVMSVSDGASLVNECTDIAWQAMEDKTTMNELKNEGWTLTECFKAMR